MAQVVAIQRGAVTQAGNNSTLSTLFTQSATGNGTRVICNMMMFKIDKSVYNYVNTGPVFAIFHTSSTGGSQLIGYYSRVYLPSQGSVNYSVQVDGSPNVVQMYISNVESSSKQSFFPTPGNSTNGATNTANTHNGPLVETANWINLGTNTATDANLYSLALARPFVTYAAAPQGLYINYMPRNFWIGPSDSIQIKTLVQGLYYVGKGTSSGPNNVTCNYSFSTVTET